MISIRRVVSLASVLSFALSTACIDITNMTTPAEAMTDSPQTLTLPAFNQAEYETAFYPEGSAFGTYLDFNAPDTYNVCAQIEVSYIGTSIGRTQIQCTRNVDTNGNVRYSLWVSTDVVGLGISQITLTPKNNQKGRSSFRLNVNSIGTNGNCCKGD